MRERGLALARCLAILEDGTLSFQIGPGAQIEGMGPRVGTLSCYPGGWDAFLSDRPWGWERTGHKVQAAARAQAGAHHGDSDGGKEPQVAPGGLSQQAGVLAQRVEGVEHLHHHQHRHGDGGRPPVREDGAGVRLGALSATLERSQGPPADLRSPLRAPRTTWFPTPGSRLGFVSRTRSGCRVLSRA